MNVKKLCRYPVPCPTIVFWWGINTFLDQNQFVWPKGMIIF